MTAHSTRKIFKGSLIALAALVITTIGISASDTLNGVSSALLGQVGGSDVSATCPDGMIATPMLATIRCVDAYEAAPANSCPQEQIAASLDTEENLADSSCSAVSEAERQPWTYVTREQARQLCMRAGKRLPTAAEWYQVAIDTPSDACVITSNSINTTGSRADCVSAVGVYDMVGNAWEWMSDDVVDGMYNNRSLPTEGYVTQVADDGVAVYTDDKPEGGFGEDFLWTKSEGMFGILRGGFYGSGSDAGVFAVQAKTQPTVSTQAIGFRCVL